MVTKVFCDNVGCEQRAVPDCETSFGRGARNLDFCSAACAVAHLVRLRDRDEKISEIFRLKNQGALSTEAAQDLIEKAHAEAGGGAS